MPDFVCSKCARAFAVPQAALDKFPGWVPKTCRDCKAAQGGAGAGKAPQARRSPAAGSPWKAKSAAGPTEENITVAEVLARYSAGPTTGLFTDGAAHPNPGPGGWGAVYVIEDRVVAERCGKEPSTTNNRMELVALREGLALVPKGVPAVIWSDSQLCVNTFTRWAKSWEARGWKRKEGEIKNLELVQEVYEQLVARPDLELRWIAAHQGQRWNEYADALATAYRRSER
ncbi:MAG: ribonuclease HI [Deltaproteobacteria bacterium]|nr:ribonuclease HI [Deltaproteobacteria bacterium]